jgi:hypothetical protein
MMPVSFDAGVIQGIELSNTIRLSQYTFEIINNNLTIFPIPSDNDSRGGYLWFEYIKVTDRINNSIEQVGSGSITNVSNVFFEAHLKPVRYHLNYMLNFQILKT